MRKIGFLLLIVSIFLIFPLYSGINSVLNISKSETAVATITSFKKITLGGRHRRDGYTLKVEFADKNGEQITTEPKDDLFNEPTIGNKITILYLRNKPEISYIHSQIYWTFLGVLTMVILVMYLLFISLYYIFYFQILNWRIKKLQTTGIKVSLPITRTPKKSFWARYSNVTMVRIVASGVNPITGKEENFKSSRMNVIFFKYKVLKTLVGTKIDIYINKKNPKKYILDTRDYFNF